MELDDFFPEDFAYRVVSNEVISNENFSGKYRLAIKTLKDFKKWLNAFEEKTNTTWILKRSLSSDERSTYIVNRSYVCQHSSYRKRKLDDGSLQVKDKNCTASFTIKIKRITKGNRRDPYLQEGLNAILNMNFKHSHLVNDVEAWTWLRRSEDTRKTFIDYFLYGMPPAVAIKHHEAVLLSEDPELLTNRRINPPKAWVYTLYESWCAENEGLSVEWSKRFKQSKWSDDSNLNIEVLNEMLTDEIGSLINHEESRGPCIIHMNKKLNDECEDLKHLQIPSEVKNLFYDYFNAGLSVSKAIKFNEEMLSKDKSLPQFNPSERLVNYIYKTWRQHKKISDSKDPGSSLISEENHMASDSPYEDLNVQTSIQNPCGTSSLLSQAVNEFAVKDFVSTASQTKEDNSNYTVQKSILPFQIIPQNPLIVIKNFDLAPEEALKENASQTKAKLPESISLLPKVDYIFDPIQNQLIAINSPTQSSVVALVNSTPVLVNSIHTNPVFSGSKISSVLSPHEKIISELSPNEKTVLHPSSHEKTVSHPSPHEKTISHPSPHEKTVSHTEANSLVPSDKENSWESSASFDINNYFSEFLSKSSVQVPSELSKSCQTTFSDSFKEPKISDHSELPIQKIPEVLQSNILDDSNSCFELNNEDNVSEVHDFNAFMNRPSEYISKVSTEVKELNHIYLPPQQNSASSSVFSYSPNLMAKSHKIKGVPADESGMHNLMESEESNFVSSTVNTTSINSSNNDAPIVFSDVEENDDCLGINNLAPGDNFKAASLNSTRENDDHTFLMALLPELENIPEIFKSTLKHDILKLVLSTKSTAEKYKNCAF